ncbi:hypothetical protein TCAL_17070 [Tigriopus californicus]|uniref:Ribosome receptor lysine/proline rich domain-containing protein n=1 Tax=Tigriopus californicus TaxID=6832 RepID=A0A553PQB2_TIGCA|nr:uncharacterized protein LOC131881839 [Tigriopus californicus]XP_059084798.1 uncharacterized protein LOC131881839 [Tigriopus californicus]XP_059084799.1 uncharacterized protein LOC131881839 [Tigriopus californicus]XP_059084800.1 uncharacterized protein LOC131881839 [Tigriopus californicus]TRY79856.1 hypothetical protein TCAL_17070 [Tigriopus californicus]
MEIVLSEVGLAFIFGLAVCIVFFFVNCFQYTLAPKTYDDALNELKSNDNPGQKGSGKKSKSKKVKLHGITNDDDDDSDEVVEDTLQMRSSMRRSSTPGQPRFKRTESIKNEHVVFADEIGPANDRHAPGVGEEVVYEIEGILHNKADEINIDPHGDEKVKNAFEHIQPLDDLGLEIRRKSLQITPSGSQSGSHRGSRSDLNLIGRESDDDHQKILRFAEAAAASAQEDTFDCKKFSKTLRKSEMTIEEINTLIEILIRKEEQSQWVDSSGKNSILFQLRKEADDRKREVLEANELTNSLQAKLKQIRGEFTEEKSTLLREKRDLEEAKANLQRELEALRLQRNMSSSSSVEGASSDRASANNDRWLQEIQELKAQLRDEKEENGALNKSVLEQQIVLKTALKQICPALGVEYCDEHQKWFESFVEKMKMNSANT